MSFLRNARPSFASASGLAASGRHTAAARAISFTSVEKDSITIEPSNLIFFRAAAISAQETCPLPGSPAVIFVRVNVDHERPRQLDGLPEALLLDVRVKRVNHDLDARAVDHAVKLDCLLGEIDEARLEPVQRLKGKRDPLFLGVARHLLQVLRAALQLTRVLLRGGLPRPSHGSVQRANHDG